MSIDIGVGQLKCLYSVLRKSPVASFLDKSIYTVTVPPSFYLRRHFAGQQGRIGAMRLLATRKHRQRVPPKVVSPAVDLDCGVIVPPPLLAPSSVWRLPVVYLVRRVDDKSAQYGTHNLASSPICRSGQDFRIRCALLICTQRHQT